MINVCVFCFADEDISSLSGSESTDGSSNSDAEKDNDIISERSRRLISKLDKLDKVADDRVTDKSTLAWNRLWVYARSLSGQLLRMYRCLLHSKKVCCKSASNCFN